MAKTSENYRLYWQHVSDSMAKRDFPRTLGSIEAGVRAFGYDDIERFLPHLEPAELETLSNVPALKSRSAQIWGYPTGAAKVLAKLSESDWCMYLDSPRYDGTFQYIGRVVHRITRPCPDLSQHLWGEAKFTIIAILKGGLISYPWERFIEDFGIAPNFDPRGMTYALAEKRIAESKYRTLEQFVAEVRKNYAA